VCWMSARRLPQRNRWLLLVRRATSAEHRGQRAAFLRFWLLRKLPEARRIGSERPEIRSVAFASGAALLFRMDVLERAGELTRGCSFTMKTVTCRSVPPARL